MSYPAPYCIYKKSAAAQFNLIPPKRNDKGRVEREGAVMLEVANAKGDKVYDWSNKLNFAIQINDIIMLFNNLDNPDRLFHNNEGTTKTLEFKQGEGKFAGTYMMTLKVNDTKITVPLSGGEYTVLTLLLKGSIEKVLGWSE